MDGKYADEKYPAADEADEDMIDGSFLPAAQPSHFSSSSSASLSRYGNYQTADDYYGDDDDLDGEEGDEDQPPDNYDENDDNENGEGDEDDDGGNDDGYNMNQEDDEFGDFDDEDPDDPFSNENDGGEDTDMLVSHRLDEDEPADMVIEDFANLEDQEDDQQDNDNDGKEAKLDGNVPIQEQHQPSLIDQVDVQLAADRTASQSESDGKREAGDAKLFDSKSKKKTPAATAAAMAAKGGTEVLINLDIEFTPAEKRQMVLTTLHQMIEDRGFIVYETGLARGDETVRKPILSVEEFCKLPELDQWRAMLLLACRPDDLKKPASERQNAELLLVTAEPKLAAKELKLNVKIARAHNIKHLIMVTGERFVSPWVQQNANRMAGTDTKCHVFTCAELQRNTIRYHKWMPTNIRIIRDPVEKAAIKARIRVTRDSQMPAVLYTKPIAKYFGANIGDIVEFVVHHHWTGPVMNWRVVGWTETKKQRPSGKRNMPGPKKPAAGKKRSAGATDDDQLASSDS